MGEYTYSLSEIGEHIEHIPDLFDEEPGIVHVTQNGKRVMEIVPAGTLKALHGTIDELSETVASLLETLEIVQDE